MNKSTSPKSNSFSYLLADGVVTFIVKTVAILTSCLVYYIVPFTRLMDVPKVSFPLLLILWIQFYPFKSSSCACMYSYSIVPHIVYTVVHDKYAHICLICLLQIPWQSAAT